jgi:hypothetical protein
VTTGSFAVPLASADAADRIPETRVYHLEPRQPYWESDWDEIQRAARAGFNAVLFPVYVNGYTLYRSEAARDWRFDPISPLYRRRDPVAEAVAVTHDLGMNFWGLVRPYNFHARYAATPHRLLRKFPQWRVRHHPEFRHHRLRARESIIACPINREYRRYLGDILTELVSSYPIDGLVLNYTGYSLRDGPIEDYPYCFCDSCARVYAEDASEDLLRNALDEEGVGRIRRWQRRASSACLEYLRHRLIKSRRTLRLVCRVQPQWRGESEEGGGDKATSYCLDWGRLLESGAVEDFLIDHDDETAPDMFRTRLVTDLAALPDDALILPAVRLTRPEDLAQPLEAVRRYPVAGFLAEFAEPLTSAGADFIREHYLNQPANSPDHHPLLAVGFFLRRVQAEHASNELIFDFMRDILRLLETQVRQGLVFETLQVIFENLTGLQTAIRRGALGDYKIPESTMRDLGLARRIIRLACLDVRT